MYRSTTRDVDVEVVPFYLADRSSPEDNHYVWAYQVTISNKSQEPLQLIERYWRITDAAGKIEEVRGAGVVGEQPEIAPGDAFKYTSGCPLRTPSGFMVGTYTMQTKLGERFDVAIPAFSLDMPEARPSIN